MKTYNFNLRYLEIALSRLDDIDESEYAYIISLIGYLQCVDKYSLDFPNKFAFRLPNGKVDKEYDDLKEWLVEKGYFVYILNKRQLFLTSIGKVFFKKLERKCLEVEEAFSHYNLARC